MPGPGTWSPGDVLTADDLNAIGTWTSYTPTLTQVTARTATVDYAEYCLINKMCIANVKLTCTTTGALGDIKVTVPLASPSSSTGVVEYGSGYFFDSSATDVSLVSAVRNSTTEIAFYTDASTANLLQTTLGANDVISFSIMYRVN